MGVSFACGTCGKAFEVRYEVAGKPGRCKRCGAVFTIPLASTTVPVPPRATPPAPAPAAQPRPAQPARPSKSTSSRSRAYEPEAMPPPRPAPTASAGRSRAYDSDILPAPRPAPAPPAGLYDSDGDSSVLLPPRAMRSADPARAAKRKKKGRSSRGDGDGLFAGLPPGARVWSQILAGIWLVLVIVVGLEILGVAPAPGRVRVATVEQTREQVRRAVDKFDSAPIALPRFPGIGPGREIEPGVVFHEIDLGPLDRAIGGPPGQGGKLWLYLPSGGAAADRSLPCVLISGAGSRLTHGMALTEGDRPEHLPYVRAGFAVLAFELEGSLPANPSDEAVGNAMVRFLAARAGLVNAHVALEYALAKVPAVDPARISIAGHSSAGVVAVLFAGTDPRLRSAVAYAPAVDLERRFGPDGIALLRSIGADDLAVRYSPKNNINNLACPLFLFQARDDTNTPAAEAEAFARQAASMGKSVTFDLVESGGHFQAMVDQGIPHAIAWLKGEPVPGGDLAAARRPDGRGPAGPGPRGFGPNAGAVPQPAPAPLRPNLARERMEAARERMEAARRRHNESRQRLGGPAF